MLPPLTFATGIVMNILPCRFCVVAGVYSMTCAPKSVVGPSGVIDQ